jgi:hypothetical protein
MSEQSGSAEVRFRVVEYDPELEGWLAEFTDMAGPNHVPPSSAVLSEIVYNAMNDNIPGGPFGPGNLPPPPSSIDWGRGEPPVATRSLSALPSDHNDPDSQGDRDHMLFHEMGGTHK